MRSAISSARLENTTTRLETNIDTALYAALRRAAERQGATLDDFVVTALQEAVRLAVVEQEVMHFSPADQEVIAQALLAPPPAAPALLRAFERHRKLMGSE